MKHRYSLVVCCFVFLALVFTRTAIPKYTSHKQLQVTTWDAFGYYMYLPSIFIYHDYKKLNWLKEKDKLYELTGGNGWQAIQETNGNYVFKYLGGVAILEMPFFFVGHFAAKVFNYPQDSFSLPYQYSLAYGILIYCFLALLLLRKILLQYFTDLVTAFTLLNLCLVTNFIQYAAVDNALSHAYIFLLYCALLFSTVKWHEQPKIIWAALIGWLIGEAVICRPTEAIMLLIPMFWNTQNKMASLEKWHLVLKNKAHVFIAFVFGILGILPQLIYWKLTTGSFVYDVGSKWQFFNPWFRVLFGFEKGWFVYTPITLFFILGLFFLKKFPFKKSVLWFCLLNIWIVISWSDWYYGGSYSTRALVQCYPVFALPFPDPAASREAPRPAAPPRDPRSRAPGATQAGRDLCARTRLCRNANVCTCTAPRAGCACEPEYNMRHVINAQSDMATILSGQFADWVPADATNRYAA